MPTDKPMVGAMRAAQIRRHGEPYCPPIEWRPIATTCEQCQSDARHFASESGLAELLTLIDNAIQPGSAPGYYNVNLPACMELVAAARRVREG